MKRKKKYVGMVNGNVVYKWAYNVEEFKKLCRMDAMASVGRFKITDYRCVAQSAKSTAQSNLTIKQ